MINVKIDKETALDMLVDRVEFWTNDTDTIELYKIMYENYIYGGVFDETEFNVMVIVDNDYINYCEVIDTDHEDYAKIKELYDNNKYYISCKGLGCEYIEAEYNGKFLVR